MSAPKYAKKVDDNQAEIVAALRGIGCDVVIIGGPVDLLVGYRKLNFLVECKKRGKENRSDQRDQQEFIRNWRGQVRYCADADEAIRLVTRSYR